MRKPKKQVIKEILRYHSMRTMKTIELHIEKRRRKKKKEMKNLSC
jgi:hypothetical protein